MWILIIEKQKYNIKKHEIFKKINFLPYKTNTYVVVKNIINCFKNIYRNNNK